jgi:hypothetical protein
MKDYAKLCQVLAESDALAYPMQSRSPAGSPFDAVRMAGVVAPAIGAMPVQYRARYGQHLAKKMTFACGQLRKFYDSEIVGSRPAEMALAQTKRRSDAMIGAVTDWSSTDYQPGLKRFQAVLSDLYRAFVDKAKMGTVGIELCEQVPPLATFAPTANWGPSTMTVDMVRDLCGEEFDVGIVSMPISYGDAPLLWGILAHECGGHDVAHAVPGLMDEIKGKLRDLKDLSPGWGAIWEAWADETTADVFGVLNLGPAFGVALAAWLSAFCCLNPAGHPNYGTLGTTLDFDRGKPDDDHPVELLRLYLVIGAVEGLTQFSTSKQDWVSLLEAIAKQAQGDSTHIGLNNDGRVSCIGYDITQLAAQARAVGKFIVTTPLCALDGNSIQDIETWDNDDQAIVDGIRTSLPANKCAGDVSASYLLAGGIMALYDNPNHYEELTAKLTALLNTKFDTDPIFGATPVPHEQQQAAE